MNLSSLRSASLSGVLVAAGLAACASESDPYGSESGTGPTAATSAGGTSATSAAGTTTTTSPTTTTATATTTTDGTATTGAAATTAGGATSTTADATSTTGSEETFTCANRPAVTAPSITDFEDYDGVTTDLTTYGFAVNDSGDETLLRYAGLYDGSDMSGTPTLLMVAGNGSNYAVQAANTLASEWGGGIGFWINCINASSFTGITMALQGTTPTGNITVTIQEEDAAGTAVSFTTEVPISDTWTVEQFPFSGFTASDDDGGGTATGDNLVGLNIGAVMTWVETSEGSGEWVPEAAPYEITLDDVAFY